MWQAMLKFFGRVVRNVVMVSLTAVSLLWAANAFLGVGPGDQVWAFAEDRMWALGEKAGDMMEDVAGVYWDEQTLLRWRTQRTIKLLGREIDRLQWVEAESTTQAQQVDKQLDELVANMETTREGLLSLANLMRMNPGAIIVDGVRYEGAQIEAYAAQQMTEFTSLQEQVELYQQVQATHRNAALNARALWMEAEQSIKTLEAHDALLEATMALESAREPNSEASRNVHQLSEQLRSQLDRNRRIVQKRRSLEDGMAADQTELIDLESLLVRSEDLADTLVQLATGTE